MADELLRSKHAFGSSENLDAAIQAKKVDSFDILFLDSDTDPKIGWIDKNGNKVILPSCEGLNEEEVDEKVNAAISSSNAYTDEKLEPALEEVESKIDVIEAVLDDVKNASYTHEKVKYEFTDVPIGTLVDYRDSEIRIMCPANSHWTKQSVGAGGDSNNYYGTLKTYVPNDDVVGYIEHLGDQVDSQILTEFSIDKYGRRYQSTWLALANYNEATNTWTYYGAKSTLEKYIGWNYQIDWYNADGVVIESDCIRINLSNEKCHYSIEPSYVTGLVAKANSYTDEQIAALNNAFAIVEF